MTFWQAYKAAYRGSIAFLAACPLLALFPTVFELLQHAIEMHIGLYDSIAAAKATEHHPLRMGFGMVKVIALIVPTCWITRFLPDRDARFARRPDLQAARLFAPYLAFGVALAAIQLFALPRTGWALLGAFVVGQVAGNLVLAWGVAAALGDPAIGPRASVSIMARHLPWTIAFMIAAILPVMIAHYALGALALMGPAVARWPVLVADSLLVAWLTAVMIAAGYFAAMGAAGRAGVVLGRA